MASGSRALASPKLLTVAALAVAAAVVWFGLGMHRGLLLSSDIKSRCWPWAPTYATRDALQAPVLSDPVWQFVPWLRLARRELAAGRLPLWNPHQDGGVPLLGNGQSALLSPLMAPALLLGVADGWNLTLLLRILTAGAGVFLLLRDCGRSRAAAVLGGAAFSLSGPFVAWLEHPHTLAAAFLPWLLYFARRLSRGGSAIAVVGVAASTFSLLVAGHPETALMVVVLSAAAVAALTPTWRDAGRVLPAALLGAMLSGPMLVPLAEYLWLSAARAGEARRPMTLGWDALIRMVSPLAEVGHPIESSAYLSVAVVALAIVGTVAGRHDGEVRFWVLSFAVMLAVGFANPIAGWLSEHTPVYWTRVLLLAPLPVAILAATGLDRLRQRDSSRGIGRTLTMLPVLAPALVVLDLLVAARGVHAVTEASELERTAPILEVLAADRDSFRILPLHTFLPPNAATDYGLDDVRGYDALAPRAWRSARESIGRFADAPAVSDALEPADLTPGGLGLDFWNVKYLLLDPRFGAAVDRLVNESGLDLEVVYAAADGIILRNRRVRPRARLLGGGEVAVTRHEATRWVLRVTTPAAVILELANPFFPGWQASVDGAAVRIDARPGEAVRLSLPPGSHRVELRYRPLSLVFGVLLALVGTVALAGWVVALPRPRSG